ncbi:hypothetical protein [Streptomyces sp. NPDC096324]|uniref:hypothetical protein n=1 Tax=Streptomyces sp. NPDC096324 TaxID=3366085 RepID=UPI0038217EA7
MPDSLVNSLVLDDAAVEKFSNLLQNEGVMQAGFVIHESNNLVPQEPAPSRD